MLFQLFEKLKIRLFETWGRGARYKEKDKPHARQWAQGLTFLCGWFD